MVKRTSSYFLFDTPVGRCGIGWTGVGGSHAGPTITQFQLPETTDGQTEARIAQASAGKRVRTPPPVIDTLVERIQKHLAGKLQDFQKVPIDLGTEPEFAQAVYAATRAILAGNVCTYGDLATGLGQPGSARAVGQALGRNPIPLLVPCHRVLAAGQKAGGFSASGGLSTKAHLLAIEGVQLGIPRTITTTRELRRAETYLIARDERLATSIVRPLTFSPTPTDDVYGTLLEAVVYQQLSGKAAATILGRVKALYPGERIPKPMELLKTPDAKLREAGLSRSKTASLKDLAAKTLDGTVPTLDRIATMSDEEIIRRLTTIYGMADGPLR